MELYFSIFQDSEKPLLCPVSLSQAYASPWLLWPGYFVLTGYLMRGLTACILVCLDFITFPSLICDRINLAGVPDTVLGEHLCGNRPISVVSQSGIAGLKHASVLAQFSCAP